MRAQVYTKFAEALAKGRTEKRAAVRRQFVQLKFAEAIQKKQLQKKAGVSMVLAGLRHAISALRNGASVAALGENVGQLSSLSPMPGAAVGRTALSLRKLLSPKITPGGRLDPRRLVSTTKTPMKSTPALDIRPRPGENVTDTVLKNLKRPDPVTRIDPAKAVGVAGGTAALSALARSLFSAQEK